MKRASGAVRGALLLGLLVARAAFAHTPGLSTAEFNRADGGSFDAVFVFATTEIGGPVSFVKRADGRVYEDAIRAKESDLAKLVTEDVVVTADGAPCPASFEGAHLAEGDAVAIAARYACPDSARRIVATLFYLNRMTYGHRQAVTMRAGEEEAMRILGADSRAIELDLPHRTADGGPRYGRWACVPLVLVLLVIFWALGKRSRPS